MANVCIRCGKERIIVEKWEEKIKQEHHTTTINHIQTSCPDKKCQDAVDKMLAQRKQKDDERRQEKHALEVAEKIERDKRAEAVASTKRK